MFAGLDTFATVTLNGVVLGRTENQHRTYRFDVAAALRDGERTARGGFAAAATWPSSGADAIGDRPERRTASRTTTCARWPQLRLGLGTALVTAGIWRAVHLERWRRARLAAVRCTPA